MVGWHHLLNEHEFEQTLEESEGQGRRDPSPWGHKELDKTERLNSIFSDQSPGMLNALQRAWGCPAK